MRTPLEALGRRHVPGLARDVTVLGAGCWPLGGPCTNGGVEMGWAPVDDETALATLRTAFTAGVTVFDTADVYGHGLSERRLGRLLAEVPREWLIVSSKVGYLAGAAVHPYDPAQMRRQLDRTLANLGTDYLDLYSFHSGDFGPDDRYLAAAAGQMREVVDRGLVRAVGMRAPHEFAAEWADEPDTPRGRRARRFRWLFHRLRPDVVTVRHNLLNPSYQPHETDIFAFARRYGVGVLVKQVLGQGLLVGRHDPDRPATFGPGDHRARKAWFTSAGLRIIYNGLRPLRDRFGSTPDDLTRIAIRYALHSAPDAVALIGVRTAEQVTSNSGGLGEALTIEEIIFTRSVGQHIRARLDAQFGPDHD